MCLAVPGKIISIDNEDDIMRNGKVDFGGVARIVNLAFVPDAEINDYILVHAGFAIGKVDEEKAIQTLSDFKLFNKNRNNL